MLWTSIQPFYSPPSPESIARITLSAFERVAQSGGFQQALTNTVAIGVIGASLTTALSVVIGWTIARSSGRGAFALDLLSYAPHVIPGVVVAVSTLVFYFLIASVVPLINTIWILVLGLTTVMLGFGVRAFRAAAVQLDRDLELSALVAGATWRVVLRRVVLPILAPTAVNIWLWTFLSAVAALTIPLVLYGGGNPVVSTLIYFHWDSGQVQDAAAMGVILMAMSLILSGAVYRWLRGNL
jgi:iron(III) transport system permease protein